MNARLARRRRARALSVTFQLRDGGDVGDDLDERRGDEETTAIADTERASRELEPLREKHAENHPDVAKTRTSWPR